MNKLQKRDYFIKKLFDEISIRTLGSEIKIKLNLLIIDNENEASSQNEPTVKAPTSTNKPKPSKRATTSSSGSYLVVAGSYLVKGNAVKMKDRLYNLGYNSEIVNFDLSQYYSVLAGRFSSRGDAKSAVTILKRNGIDSYVHTKK